MPKKYTHELFLKKLKENFGDKISLKDSIYKNSQTKVKCKCNVCGHEWFTRPYSLLAGHGCRKCFDKKNSDRLTHTLEEVNEKIHNNGVDVTIIGDFINMKNKCLVKCDKCGYEWKTIPSDLCRGHKCPKCSDSWKNRRKTKEVFINEMNILYNNEYQYKIEDKYVRNRDFITYVCPIHGEIKQLVYTHVKGNGCPYCKESGLEKKIRLCFDKNGINYKQWYKNAWLGLQSLDFFIETKNIAIEVQGIEHFEANEDFGGEKGLKNNIERDERKKTLCEKNHVRLVYFLEEKNTKYMRQNDVYFTNIENLLKYIKETEDEIIE